MSVTMSDRRAWVSPAALGRVSRIRELAARAEQHDLRARAAREAADAARHGSWNRLWRGA
jgi:hypothetical protein